MKIVYVFLIFSNFILAQATYKIEKFSKLIHATVTIPDESQDDVFKQGTIKIFDSKTKKKIIEIESPELTFDLNKNNKIKINVHELPYGEQSILIYEDFNFDNNPDLAVMFGQESCYHGPSYSIYLYNKGKFIYNDDFSALATENCGMFQVDAKLKQLHTMTKSGCCWHLDTTYKILNNNPVEVKTVEMDHQQYPFVFTTTTTFNNKKTKSVTIQEIAFDQMAVKELFSFRLEKNNKKVVFFDDGENNLYYALLRQNETVEFNYPIKNTTENNPFVIDASPKTITFSNQDTSYKMYQTINTVGIIINNKNEIIDLKGDFSTIKGNFQDLFVTPFNNVK